VLFDRGDEIVAVAAIPHLHIAEVVHAVKE
jgi:hypothetical protein